MPILLRRYVLFFATAILFIGIAAYCTPVSAAADDTLGTAIMSASVNADGSLARGSGVTLVQKDSTGKYLVTFDRSLADCTCTSAIGGNLNSEYYFGYYTTANCPAISGANVARVGTSTGNPATLQDLPFHLIVFCPK